MLSITSVTGKIFTVGSLHSFGCFKSMDSTSFFCTLATVLLCLGPDIANEYFIYCFNMILCMPISYRFSFKSMPIQNEFIINSCPMFIGGFVHQMTLLLRRMQIFLPEGNSFIEIDWNFLSMMPNYIYDVSIFNNDNLWKFLFKSKPISPS